MKAYKKCKTIYYKENQYTSSGTYTYNITGGLYRINLIGGGGGTGQTDGGTDKYSDTAYANHYGNNGADGGMFEGLASLPKGTLKITVGAVGTNRAGKGVASGHGGDSYAVFTPENGQAVEIARAKGGHSGYPDGDTYKVAVSGGAVTYNSSYFVKIYAATKGVDGTLQWSVKI